MKLPTSFLTQFVDYQNPRSFASRLRAKRVAWLLPLLAEIHAQRGEVRIIDVGGSPSYWNCLPEPLLAQLSLRISLVNLPGELNHMSDARFTFLEGDGCDLSALASQSFDLAHSNSVIEHVGSWERMQAFGSEIRRLAPHYYVQTPSFWFPIEPHAVFPLFHWLPEHVRVWLCLHMRVGRYPRCSSVEEAQRYVQDSRLLTGRQMRALFPDAQIRRERFMGLVKSYVAIK